MFPIRLIVIFAAVLALGSMQATALPPSAVEVNLAAPAPTQIAPELLSSPLSQDDQTKIQSITTSEWLGPMAPIAVSPFFGITCLAGLSQFGGDYLPANNFISNNAVLNNPMVFWVFLGLTLLTSLPRLTKVSKPFAQAMDQLETYAGIITIVVLRFAAAAPVDPEPELAAVTMVQMGWMTFSADVLFSAAAIVNVVVINSVKFFFEVLVWLVPFPFVDALLEVANKSLCVALIALYSYSPMLATIVNLVLFVACLYVFNWVCRRVSFWRTIMTDLFLSLVWSGYGKFNGKSLIGFVDQSIDSIPAKSKVILQRNDSGWQLVQQRWLLPGQVIDLPRDQYDFELKRSLVSHRVCQCGGESPPLDIIISCRYSKHLPEIVAYFGWEECEQPAPLTNPMG